MPWRERTVRMIGSDAAQRLANAKVAVFGLGGVGSYAAEALVRAGVGSLLLIDGDAVEITNLNRQLIATVNTLGMPKAEAAKARALSINPAARIEAKTLFFDESTKAEIDFSDLDYIADCIDSVKSKILLIQCAKAHDVKILSSMGTGNKLDPTAFRIADIEKTGVCPLARVMRRELKKRGISGVKALYSEELPFKPLDGERAPASISFVPSAAGLIIAGEIIRDIAQLTAGGSGK